MKGKGNLSFHPVKGPKGFYDCEKEMQSSKISMWSGYHLSIEGIRKGYLSSQKWFIKGVGPRDRASPWKTLLSAPPPPPFPPRAGTRRPYTTSVFNDKKKNASGNLPWELHENSFHQLKKKSYWRWTGDMILEWRRQLHGWAQSTWQAAYRKKFYHSDSVLQWLKK